tara:strand:+ start:146 stop:382 length:237 start_codon:yes stop_codon:yes gene_type:complete
MSKTAQQAYAKRYASHDAVVKPLIVKYNFMSNREFYAHKAAMKEMKEAGHNKVTFEMCCKTGSHPRFKFAQDIAKYKK